MSTSESIQENNIAFSADVPSEEDNPQSFASEKELAKLAAEWPGARLGEVWNSFAGVAPSTDLKPVKKFTDRKSVVGRIWAAIQRLSPDSAPQASEHGVGTAAPRAKHASNGAEERTNKKAEVLAMMKGPRARRCRNHGGA